MSADDTTTSLLSGQLGTTLKRTGAATATVGAVAGFIGDVLEPLAPIATYALYLSIATIVLVAIAAAVAKNVRHWALPIILLAFFLGLFSGIVLALQNSGEEAEERGFIAANVPAIAKFQETLGLIQQDIAEIKDTTVRIEAKTDQVLESVTSLTKLGGLIPNPATANEFYHNAKLQELNGDYGAARKSYLEYFKFDEAYLDPHLAFLEFLKVQEGSAGARESYQYIANRSKTPITQLASILLWDREKRVPLLRQFSEDNPNFAATYYLLSREFSADTLGAQSLEDMRQEKAALDKFQELAAAGNLVRYFLDQDKVATWQNDAADRLAALQAAAGRLANPVTLTWMHTSAGWLGTIQIVEPALEILWKKPGGADFESTGKSQAISYATGKPQPNPSISLPDGHPKAELEVKYVNAAGVESGVYKAAFDPNAATMEASKQILVLTKQAWVSFRDFDGKLLVYFTHLMTHRGILQEIRYGLDKPAPDTSFEFPPYDQPGNATIGADVPTYLDIPKETKSISVQLTFKDGTQSELMRFNR